MRERVFVTDRREFYVVSEDQKETWYIVKLRDNTLEPREWAWLEFNEPEEKPTRIDDDNLEEWRKVWNS